MTKEQKLKRIANYIQELIEDTNDLKNYDLTKEEIEELKAQRKLALELAVRFHLEEELE